MSERYPWTPARALEVVLCEDDVTAEEYDYFGRKKWARSSAEGFLREYIASSVPRAALEWAVRQIDGCVYRDGRECAVVESGEENEDCFDGICFEHRMQAALKAAEEATPDDV
jgi:hypothetical protein